MPERVLFIANGYPTSDNPIYAFLKPVVMGLAKKGVKCTVIAPQSISKIITGKANRRPFFWVDSDDGVEIDIYQPKYFSIPKLRFKGYKFSVLCCMDAIKRAYKELREKPDCIYAHFWDSALNACAIKEAAEVPIVVACGEETIWAKSLYPEAYIDAVIKKIKGVICVSTANYNKCLNGGFLEHNPHTQIIINAYDKKYFYHIDKIVARKELGFAEEDKIVAFVGTFNDRKGVKRLVEAIDSLDDIKLVLIGKGEKIENDNVLFCGSLPHDRIVTYLNAADIFVLPTKSEGCCNAIVEAVGCGLPIVSSDLDFNEDILDKSYSIKIDPENIDMIRKAIEDLFSDRKTLNSMSQNALIRAEELTIEKRINKIYDFLSEVEVIERNKERN